MVSLRQELAVELCHPPKSVAETADIATFIQMESRVDGEYVIVQQPDCIRLTRDVTGPASSINRIRLTILRVQFVCVVNEQEGAPLTKLHEIVHDQFHRTGIVLLPGTTLTKDIDHYHFWITRSDTCLEHILSHF